MTEASSPSEISVAGVAVGLGVGELDSSSEIRLLNVCSLTANPVPST